MQEAPLAEPPRLPDLRRHRPPPPPVAGAAEVATTVGHLRRARRPLLLVGRVGRGERAWAQRVALAERLGARVLTDLKVGAGFPTRHALHPADPGTFLPPAGRALVRDADLLVSLDWVDLGGTLRQAYGDDPVTAAVVHCSCDESLHRGWSKDHFALPPVDLAVAAHPDGFAEALLGAAPAGTAGWDGQVPCPRPPSAPMGDDLAMSDLTASLAAALEDTAPASSGCRWAGRARTWTSSTRWTTSARTGAPGSAPARAWRSAPRSRCATTRACPSRCSATATC